MVVKNRRNKIAAIAALTVFLSGCSLLPAEKEYPAAPVIKSYEIVSYKQTPVVRGDLIQQKTVKCQYLANRKEMMGFQVGGEKIDGIYVTVGQEVKAGDLLAALEVDDLEEQYTEQEYQLKKLNLQLVHAKEDWEFSVAQLDAWQTQGSKEYEEARGVIDRDYQLEKQSIEDSIYIEQLRLEQTQKSLQDRKIYAGIDGTVTYAKEITPGLLSTIGDYVITTIDTSTNAFVVSGEDAKYFPPGTECIIEIKPKEFLAVSVEPQVIGVEEAESEERQVAYLQLVEQDPTLENGDRGAVVVTLETSLDTLYVNKYAVHSADGKEFVYMLDEKGLRVMQDVTTGLEVKDNIEILSGLNEGDYVILD